MTSYNLVEPRTVRRVPRIAAVWPIATLSLFLLTGGASTVLGQQPPVEPVEQGHTPMDEVELANPQPGQPLVPVAPEKKSPFIDDSKISAQARTFYLYRDKYDNSVSEAWAIGGSVAYTSGYLADLLRVGAVAYTSQPLYAPDGRDGTLLLKPGQEGYTVLGQIYGEVRFSDQLFGAFGRKEYNTPYINKNDSRMTPNTFEALTLYGKSGGKDGAAEWRYGGGYFSKIKERNSDEFVSMSVDAGAAVERGVYVAGANFKQKDLSVGAINYYSDDIINIFYTEAKYALTPRNLSLSAQFSDQKSTGEDLLTGTDFSTHQWGVKGDWGVGAAVLTLAYTDTADGATMRSPWSGYPGYTSVQVQDFFRAGESAVLLKAAYDLSNRFKGASVYALWVHGSGVEAPLFNEDEVDLNLQWNPDKATALRGMSFRLRLAHVMQRGGGDPDITDFRFIVNYDFPRP